MKGVLIEEHGGLEKLLYKEIPLPEIKPGEALVKVRTCGLNRVDLFTREGSLPGPVPLPIIPGLEITGEVARVGSGVPDFKVGDRVAVMSRIGCGECEYCADKRENLCIRSRSLGINMDGGYAEYLAAPRQNLVPIPENLSFLQASGAPLSAVTAWHMLVTRAEIKAGQTVLILSGGSSIGSFAIQIAKIHGASVITTVGTRAKSGKALRLGADEAIVHEEEDCVEAVKRFTAKRGVDVVFEHTGAKTWEKSLACLARKGKLVTCGAHTGKEGMVDIWKLFSKELSILGSYYGTRDELKAVLRAMSDGKLSTIVHEVFPLSAARDAQRVLENRGNFGKVVLEI